MIKLKQLLKRLPDRTVTYLFMGALFLSYSCKQSQTTDTILCIDASKVEGEITPWLYGACMEDVNHEIYGGLYDQKIFGESFEEPLPSPTFNHFTPYEGSWQQGPTENEVWIKAHPGAKLVYNPIEVKNGTIETELKFDTNQGDNAGLLLHVSNPGKGPDAFHGYEISLAADGSKIILGKHKNNFEHIKDIPVRCNPTDWNNLKVVIGTNQIELFLNRKSIFVHSDNDPSLIQGKVALRTWNANAKFRHLIIMQEGNAACNAAFKAQPTIPVSDMWNPIQTQDAKAIFALETRGAFNGQNAQTIQLLAGSSTANSGTVGISNAGLNRWGIAVKKEMKFQGRIYLKSTDFKGTVRVALQSADGQTEYAVQEINHITANWQQHPFELTSDTDDTNARFAIYIQTPGKLCIDQVTLMTTGEHQFKELPYRNDIAQAMISQGLTFLRYGGTMINAPEYRFKKMIGDPDKRPPYRGHWYPYSTNGFGIEDFLKFCEAAGFTASFALNIEETPQDAADMIEYLNGPATSEWGKKRAENGHPQPYHVKYIGIGNEEVLFNGDKAEEYDHYIQRFNLLYDAIKSKDPSVTLVNTAWWRPESPNIEKVFRALDGKADYWDYHPWADQLTSGKEVEAELKKMKEKFHQWNPLTTMKCAIFEENGNTHNMQRVLGHVTLQNAVRRMGDFVLTSCAANALQPYKQNDNEWDQGQVFFTPSQVWGMPPYYAQQMASKHHLPLLVNSSIVNGSEYLDITATRSNDGRQLVVHVANTGGDSVPIHFNIKGFEKPTTAKALSLSGSLTEANTPEAPERITPREEELPKAGSQGYQIAPYSYTLFIFDNQH